MHELGHYSAALAFGFDGLKLSYASITYDGADQFWHTLSQGYRAAANDILPVHQMGLVAAAGPAMTALLIVVSVRVLTATRPSNAIAAFFAGLALTAGARSLTSIYYIVQVRPNYPGARPFFDEINAARAFDIPVDWIAWPSAALVLLAWVLVVPRLTPDRWLKLSAAIIGPVLGILIYAQIGPFIAP